MNAIEICSYQPTNGSAAIQIYCKFVAYHLEYNKKPLPYNKCHRNLVMFIQFEQIMSREYIMVKIRIKCFETPCDFKENK